MENSKRGSIPVQVDLHLNKSQCATTSAEMKRMQNVPYASVVGSIMYVVRTAKLNFVWKSSKQSTTAQHETEAEYIVASESAKEAVLIRKFIDELGIVPLNDYSIKDECDNSTAIIIAKSRNQKGRQTLSEENNLMFVITLKLEKIDIVKVIQMKIKAGPLETLPVLKLTRHATSMVFRPAK
ncbi:hypothetical protein Tco_0806520 [Tanacetum coccineum]